MINDKYNNYKELLLERNEGKDFVVEHYNSTTKSKLLLATIHGGGIEVGTTEIVKAIAGYDYSWYSFTAKCKNAIDLHITSINFDEPIAKDIIKEKLKVITFHGCSDKIPILYIGGKDVEFKTYIYQRLIEIYKDELFIELVNDEHKFSGLQNNNYTNMNKINAGVQIEISKHFRSLMFNNVDKRSGREIKTPVFNKFVYIMKNIMNEYYNFYLI